ncbi:MAG: SET domain-containing protein-lysine N-methyltransferase [Gemmatimonadetes bacterium]|nr:SET domain-containing protein-lysine N-methyltransferase [Gemmatimonadota bacterium]
MPPRKTVAEPQPFVVKRSRIQGRGGWATRDIKKGEWIVEYVGEKITWAESDRRYDDEKMSRHHTFLFTLDKRYVIDAANEGNDARYINHSCDPNCEAVITKGHIYIAALRNIKKGEELFYDYSYARDKNTTEEDEKLYVCRCGSAKCRGTILEAPKKRKKRAHHAAARRGHTAGRKKVGKKAGSGAKGKKRSSAGTKARTRR